MPILNTYPPIPEAPMHTLAQPQRTITSKSLQRELTMLIPTNHLLCMVLWTALRNSSSILSSLTRPWTENCGQWTLRTRRIYKVINGGCISSRSHYRILTIHTAIFPRATSRFSRLYQNHKALKLDKSSWNSTRNIILQIA